MEKIEDNDYVILLVFKQKPTDETMKCIAARIQKDYTLPLLLATLAHMDKQVKTLKKQGYSVCDFQFLLPRT